MHVITHLITSILVATLISFKYNMGLYEYLLAALSGALIDLDHIYYYLKFGNPKSIKKLIEKMLDAYKQPPKSGVRYHTVIHELTGLIIFLSISVLIGLFLSMVHALLIFLPIISHFFLDMLSIKMMLFSPFSKKEFYIGLLKPNNSQEKALTLTLLGATSILMLLKHFFE